MKDRVRKLRTEKLGLTQKVFGQKIGLGTQAINDIEKGRNALTDRNIEAICNTFSVNPDWLRNGIGEIFLEEKNLYEKETLIHSLMSEFDLNDKETTLLRTFLNLEPQYRTGVLKFAEEFAKTWRRKWALNIQNASKSRHKRQTAKLPLKRHTQN